MTTDLRPDRYRKRPTEIEAVQLTPDTFKAALSFVPNDQFSAAGEDQRGLFISIRTLEGTMRASEGDWIIKGVKGQLYPCRDDIFRETYEPATVSSPPPDQTALRARLAEAMAKRDGHPWPTEFEDDERDYYRRADAALAVLPPPVDRAAIRATALLWAADVAEEVAKSLRGHHEFGRSTGALDVMTELRRLAAEAQQQPTAADTDPDPWHDDPKANIQEADLDRVQRPNTNQETGRG